MCPFAARAQEHICHCHIVRHLFKRTLSDKEHIIFDTEIVCQRAQRIHLLRLATGNNVAYRGKGVAHNLDAMQEEVEPLVVLQCPGIEEHWSISKLPLLTQT